VEEAAASEQSAAAAWVSRLKKERLAALAYLGQAVRT
jgi:hypothetical protein